MKTDEYQLVQLERVGGDEYIIATLVHPTEKDESFKAIIKGPDEKKEHLWKYCKNHWDEKKIAVVDHDGINIYGVPINPKVDFIKCV
jgi:hypothetical protein